MNDIVINTYAMTKNIGFMGNIFQDFAILMGLGLILSAIFTLKKFGENRMMMGSFPMGKPLMMLLGGILLLLLPTSISTSLLAIWSSSNPLQYKIDSSSSWDVLIPPIVMLVRLMGVGSFMRGCILLSRTGGEHTQHGTMGKAILHLLGGILCINIVATCNLLRQILGLG